MASRVPGWHPEYLQLPPHVFKLFLLVLTQGLEAECTPKRTQHTGIQQGSGKRPVVATQCAGFLWTTSARWHIVHGPISTRTAVEIGGGSLSCRKQHPLFCYHNRSQGSATPGSTLPTGHLPLVLASKLGVVSSDVGDNVPPLVVRDRALLLPLRARVPVEASRALVLLVAERIPALQLRRGWPPTLHTSLFCVVDFLPVGG